MTELTITLVVDISEVGIDWTQPEEVMWFTKDILSEKGQLMLHSNEIGDTLGEVTKVIDFNINHEAK